MGELLKGLASLIWALGTFATIFYFRAPLNKLLQRLKTIGKEGVTLIDAIEDQRAQAAAPRPISDVLSSAFPGEERIPFIEADTAKLQPALENLHLSNDQEKIDLLLYRVSERNIQIACLNAFLSSFKTQMEALDAMALSSGPITLMPFYLDHKQKFESAEVQAIPFLHSNNG